MNKFVLFLFVLLLHQTIIAQSLYDHSNMLIGKIELDGTVRDGSNMMIGKFESDGTFKNRNYMMVGKIE